MSLLRKPEVLKRVGIKTSTLYKWVAAGTFPAPVRLSSHFVAWREDEITAWIESRPRTKEVAA